jgi:hypothetical protein
MAALSLLRQSRPAVAKGLRDHSETYTYGR